MCSRKYLHLPKGEIQAGGRDLSFISFSFLFHQHLFRSFSSPHQIAAAKVKEKPVVEHPRQPKKNDRTKQKKKETLSSRSLFWQFLAEVQCCRSTWWSYGNPLQRKCRLCAGPGCTCGFEKRKTNNGERAGPKIGQAGVSRVEKTPSSSVGKWSHCWLLQQKDTLSMVMLAVPKVTSLGRVDRGHSSARAERTKLTREKRTNGGDCSEQVDSVGSETMFESNGL